jgi:hypothetical protein
MVEHLPTHFFKPKEKCYKKEKNPYLPTYPLSRFHVIGNTPTFFLGLMNFIIAGSVRNMALSNISSGGKCTAWTC